MWKYLRSALIAAPLIALSAAVPIEVQLADVSGSQGLSVGLQQAACEDCWWHPSQNCGVYPVLYHHCDDDMKLCVVGEED